MIKTDILIIGGNVAGSAASITARRHYPGKETLLLRQETKAPVPCGIPYIYGTLGSVDKDYRPDALLEKEGVKFVFDKAETLDPEKHMVRTTSGEIIYDRLVLATGSLPAHVPISGVNKEGVFSIYKDVAILNVLQQHLQSATHVVVIGGGYIGVEFADEIQKIGGKTVTIIEVMPHCMGSALDEEFCSEIEAVLQRNGVRIRTRTKVVEIQGDKSVKSVRLDDGTVVPADVVILSVGAVPNVELAKTAGVRLGPTGAISVDPAMETSEDHVFACGDCAEKVSFFDGRSSTIRLATVAAMEARVAGANLYNKRRKNIGTIGVSATTVGGLVVAVAGLTESAAKQNGLDVAIGVAEGPNRHPGAMPGSAQTKLKLVFDRKTGSLLGGQARGNVSVGEMINIVSGCIQQRMSADAIATFQVATHPTLTASPGTYHLVNAAEMAITQMRK